MAYAKDTQVSVARSKAEIEDLILRYGGSEFASGYNESQSMVMFKINNRIIRFTLPLPAKEEFAQKKKNFGHMMKATPEEQLKAWEQACRSKWRALALCIKAKLESAASGITTFEEEFLAHFVMKGGKTVGQELIPQLDTNLKSDRLMLGM